MNEQQLRAAKAHYDELKYGMSNIDVKALGLREFCQRKERKKDKVRLRLWSLTPEWFHYVDAQLHPETNKVNKTEVQLTDEPYTSRLTNENARKLANCSDFSTLVHELSSITMVETQSDPLLARMENSIRTGDCRISNTFDRATLLFQYYERLIGDGLTSDELIEYDLVGMLSQYLDYRRCNKHFYIGNPRKQLNLKYLIYKYYKKDIREYENFISEIYYQESSKFGSSKLENISNHLYSSLRVFDKTISSDINFIDYWKRVEELKKIQKYEAWTEELIKRRRILVITIVRTCQKRMKDKEIELHHPFEIGLYALASLAYTIVKECEHHGCSGSLLNDNTLLELLKNSNWDEINYIVEKA